jgi:hypothetical protein
MPRPSLVVKAFTGLRQITTGKSIKGLAQDRYVYEKKNALGFLVPHLAKKSPELYVTTYVFQVLATVCRWSLP